MSQPAISQHLRKMKDAGLVNERRKGQWIIYSLNRDSLYFPMVDDVLKHIPNQQGKFDWLREQGLRISCD